MSSSPGAVALQDRITYAAAPFPGGDATAPDAGAPSDDAVERWEADGGRVLEGD